MDAAVSDEVLRAHRKEATAARPQRLEEARKEAEEEAEVLKKKFDQAAVEGGRCGVAPLQRDAHHAHAQRDAAAGGSSY